MLCRSTSSGVLSSLLPTVSCNLQTGFTALSECTERSAPDAYLSLQSPASQHLKSGVDVIRSIDGSDWDFEAGTSGVRCRMSGRFRRVQSENDLQPLWRTSSASAANFAAAGSFNSACYEGTRDQLVSLERLASEREFAILEMSENSEDVASTDSEVSEELREMPSVVSHDSFGNGKVTMGGKQHVGQFVQDESAVSRNYQDSMMAESEHLSSSQDCIYTDAVTRSCFSPNGRATRSSVKIFDEFYPQSGLREISGMIGSRSASTLETPARGQVLERSGCASASSSQNEIRGPMFITDIGFGSGGGGSGRGGVSGGRGGSGGGGYGDSNGIEAQYRRMLEADPGHPLLLRNYARFLHEVKRDPVKAEPYYERAILANPGDGEVLGQYAQLIWEVYKDEDRAGGYFDQALQACPDNCYLNAAYASFLWSSERDEEEEVVKTSQEVSHGSSSGYINMPPVYDGAATVSACSASHRVRNKSEVEAG